MSEVSYSNVPPMMAAIKSGDIEVIRSLLHAGHSPNEPQCYQVMIGDWPRDDEASPLELAVLENRMDMVQLLIECGADLTHNPEELLCGSLRSQDLTLFSFLVDVGVRIPATQRDICRLFLHLMDRDEPNVLPILKRMGMDLKQYGGEACAVWRAWKSAAGGVSDSKRGGHQLSQARYGVSLRFDSCH